MLDKNRKKNILIIFFSQLVLSLLLAGSFYLLLGNKNIAFSILLGGLVYCGPSLFANFFMERASTESAQQIVAKAYLATLYKTIITIVLLVYVYQHISMSVVYFVTGYLVSYLAQYIMSFVLHYRN